MFERGEESTAQQTLIAFEKRTAESDLRVAAALALKRQPHTLFAHEHGPAERPNGGERDTESTGGVTVNREPERAVQTADWRV